MFSLPSKILCLLLLVTCSLSAWAAKTDIVVLKNGDRITGEVKNLERGKLQFSTDTMGTVYIEWEDIQQIFSSVGQAIELTNGQRFYGPLAKSESEEIMLVKTNEGPVGLSTTDIVSMYPVEATFWDRLDISADLGFSWDKASNVGKYTIGLKSELRNPRFINRNTFSSELTTQQGRDDTARASFDALHLVFHQDKRYHAFFGTAENNDELGVDLRVLVGAGYGAIPIRSQRSLLSIGAGLALNHEIPTEGESHDNLEAVGMLTYDYFKYSDPERSFTSNLRVFPSLTDSGRWRATFDLDFRFELVKDFYWRLNFYSSYDSDPISEEAATSTSDYGVTSSLGYKF
jgi:hypothetical protein